MQIATRDPSIDFPLGFAQDSPRLTIDNKLAFIEKFLPENITKENITKYEI